MRKAKEDWLKENGDKTDHYGFSVDLSINEAKRLLSSAQMRKNEGRVQFFINGVWMDLCRTDLKDDICTRYCNDVERDLEETRQMYLAKIRYGARIKRGEAFAVVDALSDG